MLLTGHRYRVATASPGVEPARCPRSERSSGLAIDVDNSDREHAPTS
jgi:hypothetical protein